MKWQEHWLGAMLQGHMPHSVEVLSERVRVSHQRQVEFIPLHAIVKTSIHSVRSLVGLAGVKVLYVLVEIEADKKSPETQSRTDCLRPSVLMYGSTQFLEALADQILQTQQVFFHQRLAPLLEQLQSLENAAQVFFNGRELIRDQQLRNWQQDFKEWRNPRRVLSSIKHIVRHPRFTDKVLAHTVQERLAQATDWLSEPCQAQAKNNADYRAYVQLVRAEHTHGVSLAERAAGQNATEL